MAMENEDLVVLEEGQSPETVQACCSTNSSSIR